MFQIRLPRLPLRDRLRALLPPYGFSRVIGPVLERTGLDPVQVRTARVDPAAVDGVRMIWSQRPDLRAEFPLGLTPQQFGDYAHWLLTYGRQDYQLPPNAVVAYFHDLHRDRSHGLVETYLWSPEWQQAQPAALTVAGWPAFRKWVAARYGIRASWLRRAVGPKRPTRDLDRPGINILSHFRQVGGLQVEGNHIAAALEAAGYVVARRDIPVRWPCDSHRPADCQDLEEFDVSFVKISATMPFDEVHRLAGLFRRPGVYRIVGWSWELADFPAEALDRARTADEIWLPSEFCAHAVRQLVADRPVFAMPPGMHLPAVQPLDRGRFGLKPTAFLFIFFFDMNSVMARKNPLGLIRAFRRAFPPHANVQLVIKVSNGTAFPDPFAQLTAAATAANAIVIDRVMSREESYGLMACCDAYISLHRAEGFGLTVAEAMAMGKPVIATDYSATAEFLTPETGLPVRYQLVPVGPGCEPYSPVALWAEPDEAHAAERMRWVVENHTAARALGERAKAAIAANYSPAVSSRRMIARLAAIRAAR